MRVSFVSVTFWLAGLVTCLPLSEAQTAAGSAPERALRFEVLSIRPIASRPASHGIPDPSPNGFRATASISEVVKFVYSPPGPAWTWLFTEMRNDPAWFATEYFDIEARVAQADMKAWQTQGRDHQLLRSALRTALKERCKLAIHDEPSRKPIYELVVGRHGPKMTAAGDGAALPAGMKLEGGGVKTPIGSGTDGGWKYYGATMLDLAEDLTILSPAKPVRDRTGLPGHYNFSVRRVELEPGEDKVYAYLIAPLGLELRPATENRPILVIDHVERPTPN